MSRAILDDKTNWRVDMFKKIILGLLILPVGYAAGLISHLYYYPREAFGKHYENIVKEGGKGRWVHRRQLNDHTFTDFPRPNNDTLYSYCMVDLSKGPVVIETPPIDRYWSVQFLQDNTDTFHYLASRIQGLNKPVSALLVPKGYEGESHGLEVVQAPTQRVWLFARILIDGPVDIPQVVRLQDQMKCTPLNQYKSEDRRS
jgi:hypothetical protein